MNLKGDKAFGIRIKELREKKKLTQEQLAELLDMDSRSLSRIETGISFTTIDKLKKLAHAFDVEVKELFTFEHAQEKNELLTKINDLLTQADAKDIRTIYKIILTILR